MTEKRHQKTYIILNFIIFSILLGTFFLIDFGKNMFINAYAEYEFNSQIKNYQINLKNHETKLKSIIKIISNDEKIKKSFLSKDRGNLYSVTKPYMQDLFNEKEVSRLLFITLDDKVFLRVHDKSNFNDIFKMASYKLTKKTKQIQSGLDVGKIGLSLRVTSPYYSNNKLIGYLQISSETDDLINNLQNITDNLYFIVMDKNKLKDYDLNFISNKNYTNTNLANKYLIKDDLIFYKTTNPYFDYIQKIAPEISSPKNANEKLYKEIKIKNKAFVLGSFPIFSNSKQKIAQLIYLKDISDFYKTFDFIKYLILLFLFINFLIIILVSRKLTVFSHKELYEKNLSTIIENSWNEVVVIDPQDFTYIYLNKKVLDECGYKLEELAGKQISQITAFSYEKAAETIQPLISGKIQTLTYETTRIRRDGSTYPVIVNLQLMEFWGTKALVAICENISKRKEEEKTKNEFVSIVSHELRTPLTSIIGVLGLLLNSAISKDAEKSKELLNIAQNNSKRLLSLVNDILDIQKIEAGKIDFYLKDINLNEIIKNVIELNNSYAEKYHVSLNFLEGKEEDIFVYADKDRLIQSITNLVSNAIKFSPLNEVVNISLKTIDNTVRISVEDKGKGISDRSKIFKKFSQVDSSATRSKEGTGLGLYITKFFIEKMNGKIDFESSLEEGTHFYVDFPMTEAAK
jgi:PAS domain S-box-containing protein